MATKDYEQEVFRLLYKNMNYNGFSGGSGNTATTLIKSFTPIVMAVALATFVGLIALSKVLFKGAKFLYNKIKEHAVKRKAQRELDRKAKEELKQEEQARLEQENDIKVSQGIYDKAVLQLKKLIDNNNHVLNVSILHTGRPSNKKEGLYTWVNFSLFDNDLKEVVNVNDLINTVCFRRLAVSTKDGKYLEGSLIFSYTDYMELENQLRTLLQTVVSIYVA